MAAGITPENAHNLNRRLNLETVVGQKIWATPQASEEKANRHRENPNAKGSQIWLTTQVLGLLNQSNNNTIGKSQGQHLNPNWVEQMMGLPVGWTDLGSWATE